MSQNQRPTQANRVLEALEVRGRRGISAPDFLLPNVIDGGKPILRLPSRIFELREAGYDISASETDHSGCAIYRLAGDDDPATTQLTERPTVDPATHEWEQRMGITPRPTPTDETQAAVPVTDRESYEGVYGVHPFAGPAPHQPEPEPDTAAVDLGRLF